MVLISAKPITTLLADEKFEKAMKTCSENRMQRTRMMLVISIMVISKSLSSRFSETSKKKGSAIEPMMTSATPVPEISIMLWPSMAGYME